MLSKFGLTIIVMFTAVGLVASVPVRADTAASASTAQTQQQLESELQDVEQQISLYSSELAKTQTQKATLANKIKQLQARQKTLNLQIKETTIKLTVLGRRITTVENHLTANQLKERQLIKATAAILRQLNSVDNNLVVALASSDGASAFFDQIQGYSEMSRALYNLRNQTLDVRKQLNSEQDQLVSQKTDTANLLQIKSIQEQGLIGSLGEQKQLLIQTKGLESNYQQIINDGKKRAADIRNRIYELFNNMGNQITFGEAAQIAAWASGLTGIRPAFLLAILTQESNLGKNIGTCNRPGDPPEKGWRQVMNPDRDQAPFQTITGQLGLDPDVTPVSCPMHDSRGRRIGWGGAMGPAQFIPSTWMGWRDKVATITGKSASPWNIRDAFLAAALKLKDNGADGTDNGDWSAAMRYFAGAVNRRFRFYGDNVMATTKQYIEDLKSIQTAGVHQ